ncbi:hypothetical protein BJ980_002556 [Nocardioides daedukensis]|uniref:Uncharacterized protein n=1 Tax=Nocardioides daedukensis TaxID=634462 RepID=A0A7Y9S3W7_9ACTN|nr:hypothetical protein [Nocardioides daedukensis]NYG59633.1 hypothetical protein [Nocardioides daedukensis]
MRAPSLSRITPLLIPTAAVLAALVVIWAIGPLGIVLVLAPLLVPRLRHRILGGARDLVGWRSTGTGVVVVAALAGLVLLLPDGLLPIPPGIGALTTPSYVGHPATARPISGVELPQHPFLARNGANNMHNDAGASDAYTWAGPRGSEPSVKTAWYGIEECATLAFDRHERLIALCGDVNSANLHIIDPDSMRKLDSFALPARPKVEGTKPWENLCGGAYFYLDAQDRAVVATSDRRVLTFTTSDSDGEAQLAKVETLDLSTEIPDGDCLIALLPDWDGRIWFESQGGLVGVFSPDTGQVRVHDLGEELVNSFSVDETGGVYIVSAEAFYRFEADPKGAPRVAWRTTYDRGVKHKPGQLSQGSGTTPTVVDERLVAITDNADDRMNVVFHDRETGKVVCKAPVFESGRSATENSLVTVDGGVIVENNYGYTGPQRVMLGRASEPGIARVNVNGDDCEVAWTSDVVAPTSVPKVSLETGLLYVYAKRPNLWGVNAWYFTGINARTGKTVFSVRTGLGTLFNNHYAAVTIAPDGSAFIATLAGMVRVRDRS